MSPPANVEQVLVNGQMVTCLNDTGCQVEAVVKASLVRPGDFLDKIEYLQMADLESPPKAFRKAKIDVESRYVRNRIEAVVMEAPAYDLILGCRHVYLGTPPYPSVSAPVITRAQAKDQEGCPAEINPTPGEMRSAQRQDPSPRKCFKIQERRGQSTERGTFFIKEGLLYRRGNDPDASNQLVVPGRFRDQVISTGHASSLSAHLGQDATLSRIEVHYYWPGMQMAVKRYVSSCPQCQKTSPRHRVLPVPLGKTPLIDTPFKRVSVDLLGPLPRTKRRNAYILCVICQASRWPEAAPLPSIDAKHVADALFTIFTSFQR
nr:hypothetical protein BgiMline_029297 [Biomphalaria glabrata]